MKVIHLNEKEAVALARLAVRQDLTNSSSEELSIYRHYIREVTRCFALIYDEQSYSFVPSAPLR